MPALRLRERLATRCDATGTKHPNEHLTLRNRTMPSSSATVSTQKQRTPSFVDNHFQSILSVSPETANKEKQAAYFLQAAHFCRSRNQGQGSNILTPYQPQVTMSGVNGEPLGVSGRSMRDIFEVGIDLELSPDSFSEGNQQRRSSPKEGQPPPPPLERAEEKRLSVSAECTLTGSPHTNNNNRSTATHIPSASPRYEGGGGGLPWDENMIQPPGDKPKRPLSAYNFFFQLERERIINSDLKDRDAVVKYTVDDVARIAMVQQQKAKNGKTKEKRSHRRTHGKISFGDLARTIANKWKQLDESSKSIFEGSATMEKERYRKELGEWNKKQKKWKEATAKMTQQRGMYPPSIVTPTQVPKSTMHSDGHHIMTTLMHQQKKLLQDSGFAGSPGASPRNDNRLQQPYPEYRPGAAAADMYEAEQEYYRQDHFQGRRFGPGGYGGPNPYADYDRLTDDTYQMAQMALPRYQQMWMQQRRMQEMALMQQQQEQMRHQIASGRQQQQHPDDYLMERAMDRAMDRGMDRGLDRGMDRGLDRSLDRAALDRGMERAALDRGMDRAHDRGMERQLERGMDRGMDRAHDRSMDRGGIGRSVERDVERGMDRTPSRSLERPTDREMDRTTTPTDMLLKEEMPMESSPHPYHQSELRASYDI